jgi:hypothetical protein
MKSQDILTCMIKFLGQQVGSYSERDIKTVISRVACEGDAFLEITLPQLDDALLAGLSTGFLPPLVGWKTKKGWSHPEFLHGFWMRIFLPDGSLSSTACPHSMLAIRQISRAYKKVFEVCSDARQEVALQHFKATDAALSQVRIPAYMETLSDIAHYLFGGIVGTAVSADHVWKHGPGAVSEGYDSVYRWDFPTISANIAELVGPETFRPTWDSLITNPPSIEEIPARLVAVPKTAMKPRLISIEPSYNQFIQQGYHTLLKDGLSRFPVCNITDQERNRRLARLGSIDGSLATIDLSDASDRVHYGLIRSLFRWSPTFVDVLEKTRSRLIQTPSEVLILNKFASMGSALTFPVETMFFLCIVVYTMCESVGDFSRKNVVSYLHDERIGVYGDDIIVPVSVVPKLMHHLEELGLKVNTQKSFSTGGFRESCGGDYWKGYNITPFYVRRRMPRSINDVTELVALSSFRNNWVSRHGYSDLTSSIDETITNLIGYYPAARQEMHLDWDDVPDGVRGICRYGPDDLPEGRWSPTLFRREVKIPTPIHVRKRVKTSEQAILFKTLYRSNANTVSATHKVSSFDSQHLSHHSRPVSAKIKHRWLSVG